MRRRVLVWLAGLIATVSVAGCVVVVPGPVISDSNASPRVVGYTMPPQPDPGPAPASARCADPALSAASKTEVLARVNSARRAVGVAPVRASARLARIAHAHACDNAARSLYSHVGSDGSDLRARLNRGGYRFRTGAENVGIGFQSAERMMQFWMASPGHRTNILNPKMTEIGIGLANSARPNWVMVLAAPR